MADDPAPATFFDPWTLVYERTYPHPIERVFEAVSTGEHLDAWFIPICTVERKLGGACTFTWGGPPGSCDTPGTVTRFDPPRLIRYTLGQGSDGAEQYIQFELEATADGTLLRFTQAFMRGSPNPWRAGLGSGYHLSLDGLRKFLDGTWTRANMDAALAGQNPESIAEDIRWIPVYGALIRSQWPARHIRREGDPGCPAVEAYLAAILLRSPDAVAALRRHLADDVVHESRFEIAKGPDGVLETVTKPELAAAIADLRSTEVACAPDGDTATAHVRVANEGAGFTGFDYTFELRDGRITRILPKAVFV